MFVISATVSKDSVSGCLTCFGYPSKMETGCGGQLENYLSVLLTDLIDRHHVYTTACYGRISDAIV